MAKNGVVRQMRDLPGAQVSDRQVQRILSARVRRLDDQNDEERVRVVNLVAQTVGQRKMHLEEGTFQALLQQVLYAGGESVFGSFSVFFAAQVKNGYRLKGRDLLTELRGAIKAEYRKLGGFERKLELRRSLPVLSRRDRGLALSELNQLKQLELAEERARALLKLW